jgi:hypothetical protein
LFIIEDYLIISSDDYPIVVYSDQIFKQCEHLPLLSCGDEVLSVSLVEGARESIHKQQSYSPEEKVLYGPGAVVHEGIGPG